MIDRYKRLLFGALALGFLVPSASFSQPADPTSPVPATHRATYAMSMVSSKSSSVVNVSGTMNYEFADACDAWSSSQKFALDYVYADEPEAKFDSQYTSNEAKDDSHYDFAVRRLRNGEPEEEFSGSAHRNPDGTGTVSYATPVKKDMDLPKGFYFPTAHTLKVIGEAMQGHHIFNGELFDGSDGEGALEVNAIVGDVVKPVLDNDQLAANPLLQAPAYKVRMAFYPPDTKRKGQEEAEPDYEMTMIMHANGVVSSMQIDYDQFSVKGDLQSVEAIPAAKCDK
jgi:hypothetical protein